MGYTHYWKRRKEITVQAMQGIVSDFNKALVEINKHMELANGWGEGKAIISVKEVCFNGLHKCGHEKHELGITWPSANAGGVAVPFQENAHKGEWFAGAQLEKRMCGGDCSHETFSFPRVLTGNSQPIGKIAYFDGNKAVYNDPEEIGLYFDCCKTAFKPYDLAVITFLIIAKHHLGNEIIVSSDGNDGHWFDGKMLCQINLGYGLEYAIDNKKGRLIRKEETADQNSQIKK